MTTIRAATPADLPAVLDLGEEMHRSSVYVKYSFDRRKVHDLMSSVMRGSGVLFVAEQEFEGQKRVVGGFAGGVTEFWFGHDLVGFDYALFLLPDHRVGSIAYRLLVAFESWCKRRGAREIRLGITTGINVEATSSFYLRMGYADAGRLFTKELLDVHGT